MDMCGQSAGDDVCGSSFDFLLFTAVLSSDKMQGIETTVFQATGRAVVC